MLHLEVLLGLKSKQGDATDVFLQTDVEEGENMFVEMTRAFQKKENC